MIRTSHVGNASGRPLIVMSRFARDKGAVRNTLHASSSPVANGERKTEQLGPPGGHRKSLRARALQTGRLQKFAKWQNCIAEIEI